MNTRLFYDISDHIEEVLYDSIVTRQVHAAQSVFRTDPVVSALRLFTSSRDDLPPSAGEAQAILGAIQAASDVLGARSYLFAADGLWQVDNRVVRHKKLWNSSSLGRGEWPKAQCIAELSWSSNLGIRFYGACSINEHSIGRVLEAIFDHALSVFIVITQDAMEDPLLCEKLFVDAFSGHASVPDTHIDWLTLLRIRTMSGVIAKRASNFNETASCLDLFGPLNVIKKCESTITADFSLPNDTAGDGSG